MRRTRHLSGPRTLSAVLAAGLAAVLALGLASAPGGAAAAPSTDPATATPAATVRVADTPTTDRAVPRVRFRDCGRFRCARVPAPLDYDAPDGATVSLAVLKVPARKPSRRLGTLFVNPGGPGGSATEFATYAGQFLGSTVRNRFDIVGIDPRGVGGTADLLCEGRGQVGYPRQAYPRTATQIDRWLAFDAQERRLCEGRRILDHMSTADVARDMDHVRRALREDTVSYFGASYGSMLGSTYAALFPSSVRALVVDGVLDPVAWTSGRDGTGTTVPVTTRLGSGEGSREALVAGLAACDAAGRPACPVAGDALGAWDTVADRLQDDRALGRAIRLSYDDFVGTTLGLLYAGDLSTVARMTAQARRAIRAQDARGRGAGTGAAVADLAAVRRAATRTVDALPFPGPDETALARTGSTPSAPGTSARARIAISGAFHGVLCSDSVNPSSTDVWPTAADTADAAAPDFGPLWTWSSSACVGWPGSGDDAYRGPFATDAADRMLIVNNRYDPATPLTGALALQGETGARLVTARAYGHVATGTNRCATRAVSDFLVSGVAPAADRTCSGVGPFG